MAFLVYLVVAVITVFGVMLEADLLVEPAHKVEISRLPAAPVAAAQPAATDARASETPANPAPAAAPQRQTAAVTSGKCDVTACAVAYESFRASDCTYQSSRGPRELCTKGVASDPATAEAVLNAHADAETTASVSCHVSACAAAYHSFTAADCTYQPTEGPRRLCAK